MLSSPNRKFESLAIANLYLFMKIFYTIYTKGITCRVEFRVTFLLHFQNVEYFATPVFASIDIADSVEQIKSQMSHHMVHW